MQHHAQRLMSALALAAAVSLWAVPGAAALAPESEPDVYYDPYGIAYFAVDGEELPVPEEPEEWFSDTDEETPEEETEEEPAPDPDDPDDPDDEDKPAEESESPKDADDPDTPEAEEDSAAFDLPEAEETSDEETISVQVSWGAMEFTYDAGTWDADTLEYSGDGWKADHDDGNEIAVTNNSNTAVTVNIGFTKPTDGKDYDWLTAQFADRDDSSAVESSAVNQQFAAGDTRTYYLKLYGMPPRKLSGEPIGTITVSLCDTGGAEEP